MHRIKLIQLKADKAWLYASILSSTVQIWRSTCRGFKGQPLYTKRENPWFCVENRAGTTAKAPMGFLIIHFFSIIL